MKDNIDYIKEKYQDIIIRKKYSYSLKKYILTIQTYGLFVRFMSESKEEKEYIKNFKK